MLLSCVSYYLKVDKLQQSDQEREKEKEQAEGQPVALGKFMK